jgi:hypothetical protein
MPEYYFSVRLDGNRTLHVAPLTNRRIAMSGQEIVDASGYFLFESYGSGDNAEIEILAQAVSEEAALRLLDMLNMG